MATAHVRTQSVAGPRTIRAGRREWIGLALLTLPCVLYSMDQTVLYLAVPRLSADLEPSGVQMLWIVDAYGFLLAGCLLPLATLGDRMGRRRVLLAGAGAFAVASMVAAWSSSATVLILARALMGVAAAALAPSTLSLIRTMFPDPGQRMTAIGIWTTGFSAGSAVGPLAGGLVLEHFWWGSVFLLAVPGMLLLVLLGPVLLPEHRDPRAGRLDVASAALSLAAMLAVVYGIKQLAQDGLAPVPVLAMLAGLGLGALFVRRQSRLADPLLDLRLFRAPGLAVTVGVLTLAFFITFAALFGIAQYLQLVLGLSPLLAGAWTVPSAIGFVAGSLLAPVIVRRVRAEHAMAGGLAVAAVGFGILAGAGAESGLAVVVTASVVLSCGLAPVFTLATDLIVSAARPRQAGAASGLAETGSELGGALGVAALGSLGTAVYRGQIAGGLPPGIPPAAAATARDTMGGAVDVAAKLPDELGAALLATAREAFMSGMRISAAGSAVLAVGLAVVTLAMLRSTRAGPPAGRPSGDAQAPKPHP